jgi:hypothetical protein
MEIEMFEIINFTPPEAAANSSREKVKLSAAIKWVIDMMM